MTGLQVTDYRGISSATIKLAPTLTLVAGLNHAGKSSLFECLAACLTGIKTPVSDVKVSESHLLVRDGAIAGSATLSMTDGSRTIQWSGANATIVTTGKPPHASEYGAGLKDFLSIKPADRAAILQEYLQFEVTEEHLQAALPDVAPDRIKLTWGTIKVKGWEAAHTDAKTTGTKLKAQWEQLTGLNFKPTVVLWQPEQLANVPALALKDARQQLEDCLRNEALADADRHRMGTLAEQLPGLVAAVEKQDAAMKAAEIAYREAQDKAPEVSPKRAMECPHCNGRVVMMSNMKLSKADNAPTYEEVQAQQEQAAAHTKRVERLREEWINSRCAYDKVAEQARSAHVAKLTLEEHAAKPKPSMSADAAREAVKHAEEFAKLSDAAEKANTLHANWRKNQAIIDCLAPDGLRQQRLAEALDKFNARLKQLCDHAGWADVVIRADMSVIMGARPLALVSASERFRARVTIQAPFAQIDKSGIVAVDAADILDNPGRAGLAKLAAMLGVPFVVFLTANRLQDVPDLARDGRGLTYWVQGNTVLAGAGVQS